MSKLIDKEELLKYVTSVNDLMDDLSLMEKIFVTKEYLRGIKIFDKLNESKALRKVLEQENKIDENEVGKND